MRRPYLTKRGALAGFALDWNKTGMLRERKKSTFQFGPSVFNVRDMHARPPRSIGHKTHPKPKGRARTMRARGDSFAVAWATLDTRVLGAPPQWPTATLRQHPVSVPAGGPRVPHAELRCGHAVRPGPWRVRGARGPGRRSWRHALCRALSAPPLSTALQREPGPTATGRLNAERQREIDPGSVAPPAPGVPSFPR